MEYTDSSIPGGGAFELLLGEYINGSLSPDLHPKYVVPNLTMQLPASYLVSASVIGDSIHNITVPNASYSSHQLGGYGII